MLTELGKYKIAKEMDRGGMGAVYRAFDTNLGRMVALKVLSPHLGLDDSFVERFRREAKMAAGLRHRNIVTIYDMGAADDQYYIAMEYVEGPNLREEVRTAGRMAPRRAATILKQLASALDYAHEQGVIHRDIKPSNILLEAEDEVKLADFGIAKALSDSTTGLTGTQIRIGTPHYMSPEQAEGKPLTAVSDVYSLGVVVYEMLAGRTPFTGTTTAVLLAHISKRPPSLSSLVPGFPAKVEKVVFKALEKQPQKRYQTAGEFARAFQEAVDAPVRPGPPVRLIAGLVAGTAIVLLLAFLAWQWLTGGATPPPTTVKPTSSPASITLTPLRSTAATIATVATRALPTAGATTRVPGPVVASSTASPRPTVTVVPTVDPRQVTVTPVPPRTPATVRPAAATAAPTGAGAPTEPAPGARAPILSQPAPNETVNRIVEFSWQPAGALPAGAAYEVVWWDPNTSPTTAQAIAGATSDTVLRANLDVLFDRPRLVYWTVLVVRPNPYLRLTQPTAAEGRALRFCREECDPCTVIDPVTGEPKPSTCCRFVCP